jgi:hypothetical protein
MNQDIRSTTFGIRRRSREQIWLQGYRIWGGGGQLAPVSNFEGKNMSMGEKGIKLLSANGIWLGVSGVCMQCWQEAKG